MTSFTMFEKDCIISFISVTCLKFLFIPLYKSTDFEVHRNWMAIVHEKPLKDWYFEETSEWTLDYPPLFAWFEYILAYLAKYFDPRMLQTTNLNYSSPQTVFFMRLSVILSDIVYFYGVNRIYKLTKDKKSQGDDPWIRREMILAMLLLWNPGLLLVDHIHFQYNGFLMGILFISIADMFEENYVLSAFWFSVLLNLKHIFLYISPAYFLFLLKKYCFKQKISGYKFCFSNFMKLAAVGLSVLSLSFGPFIYMGQLNQILSRLFPVKRGLTHSYWAPNIWALYNFADRGLSYLATILKLSDATGESCGTKGLVQECQHAILPHISSGLTILLAGTSFLPVMWLIWKQPASPKVFLDSIILCSFGSFLFGYHVHEKAVLMILLPMAIAAVVSKDEARTFVFLSIVGHFSLFPLLYKEGETVLKIFLLLLHAVYSISSLYQLHRFKEPIMTRREVVYLCGIITLQVFYSFGAKILVIEKKLPFLSLMLISTYCALGVIYAWIKYLQLSLQVPNVLRKVTFRKIK